MDISANIFVEQLVKMSENDFVSDVKVKEMVSRIRPNTSQRLTLAGFNEFFIYGPPLASKRGLYEIDRV